MKNILNAMLTASLLLTLTSCGKNSDPVKVLEREIEARYRDYYNYKDLFELTDFEKTNGQQGEALGISYYNIDYKATFTLTEDRLRFMGHIDNQKKLDEWKDEVEMHKNELPHLWPTDTLDLSKEFHRDGYIIGHLKGADENSDYYISAAYVFKLIPKGTEFIITGSKRLVKKDNGWE